MSQLVGNHQRASNTAYAGAKQGLRPDIQGLRALAVLLVVADHMFHYPSGGFVGVDVFFVISGFLITGLLIREHQRKGRVSFVDFYRRRAKRILPLAILVLAITVGAAWALFPNGRAWRITEDGLWSLVFGTNWHLAAIGTNYMQDDGLLSPLQHFWSLAVEEQFYVVWPWVIVLVLGLAAKAGRSATQGRARLAAVMGLLTVASFAFAMWETANNPTFAYFSTFSRAWELGLGALLAVFATVPHRIPDAVRAPLSWVGFLGIVASAFFITPDSPFPAPWAAAPVIFTALLIAAGTTTTDEPVRVAPLTNPVSRYLGDISYSIYLWHFPALVLIGAVWPLSGPVENLIVLGVILAVSALSYYFVEDAVRSSSWLEPKAKRVPRVFTGQPSRAAIGGLVALAIAAGGTTAAALMKSAPVEQPPVAMSAPLATTGTDKPVAATGALSAQIGLALSATSWPELKPSVDELGPSLKATEWVQDGCLSDETKALPDPIANSKRCVYGDPDAAKTAVVLGDSLAISYVSGIRKALEPAGYKVLVYTMQQCPAVDVSIKLGDGSNHAKCDPFREWAFGQIRATNPDLVLMTSAYSLVDHLASGATGDAAVAEWQAGEVTTIKALDGAAKKLVVLDPPPTGKQLQDCATRVSKPADCATQLDAKYLKMSGVTRAAAQAAAPATPFVQVLTKDWFCSGNSCPAFVGTTPIYADNKHLTPAYSESLAPVITEALNARS